MIAALSDSMTPAIEGASTMASMARLGGIRNSALRFRMARTISTTPPMPDSASSSMREGSPCG